MGQMMKEWLIAAFRLACCFFFLGQLICPSASARDARELTSFKTGFFYASVSRDDGLVQLSDCRHIKEAARASHNRPFVCVRDNNGFRCTARESLDVIFLFKDKKECESDRKKILNSDEE